MAARGGTANIGANRHATTVRPNSATNPFKLNEVETNIDTFGRESGRDAGYAGRSNPCMAEMELTLATGGCGA